MRVIGNEIWLEGYHVADIVSHRYPSIDTQFREAIEGYDADLVERLEDEIKSLSDERSDLLDELEDLRDAVKRIKADMGRIL